MRFPLFFTIRPEKGLLFSATKQPQYLHLSSHSRSPKLVNLSFFGLTGFFILVLVFLFTFILGAFSPVWGGVLNSLSRQAVSNSKLLNKQSLQLDIQKTEIQSAWAEALPKIDTQYSASYSDYSVSGRDPLAQISVEGTPLFVYPFSPSRYRSIWDTTLTQTLYAGGRILANIDIQELRYTQCSANYALLKETTIAQTLETYWQYALSFQEEQYFDFVSETLQKKQQGIQLKKTQGLTTSYQDLSLELSWRKTQEDLKKAKAKVELKKKELESLTKGDAPYPPLSFEQPYSQLLEVWEKLSQYKQNKNIDLIRLESDICIAEKKQIIDQSQFLPEIYLQTGISYFGSDNDRTSTAFCPSHYGDFSASVVVNWNLFNGFKDEAKTKKSALEKSMALLELEEKKNQYSLELEQKTIAVEEALKDAKFSIDNLELAQKLYHDSLKLWQIHKLSQDELFDSQISLKKNELDAYKSMTALELAFIAWSKTAHATSHYISLRDNK